jgi:hypothetical protein
MGRMGCLPVVRDTLSCCGVLGGRERGVPGVPGVPMGDEPAPMTGDAAPAVLPSGDTATTTTTTVSKLIGPGRAWRRDARQETRQETRQTLTLPERGVRRAGAQGPVGLALAVLVVVVGLAPVLGLVLRHVGVPNERVPAPGARAVEVPVRPVAAQGHRTNNSITPVLVPSKFSKIK